MDRTQWKNEAVLAIALLGIGLFVLPIAVYWVGQHIVGEYAEDLGLWDLVEHVWLDLARGGLLAWMLVLGPLVVVELTRAAWAVWRSGRDVMNVTFSDADQ